MAAICSEMPRAALTAAAIFAGLWAKSSIAVIPLSVLNIVNRLATPANSFTARDNSPSSQPRCSQAHSAALKFSQLCSPGNRQMILDPAAQQPYRCLEKLFVIGMPWRGRVPAKTHGRRKRGEPGIVEIRRSPR